MTNSIDQRRLPRPKAVLFDLDCTLTDRDAGNRVFVRRLLEEFADLIGGGVEESDAYRVLTLADAAGYAPRRAVCAALIEGIAWNNAPPVSTLLNYWESVYWQCVVVRPGLHDTLASLREAGLRLGVISNGNSRMQRGKLEALRIPAMDTTVISGEVGHKKPDAAIFQAALEGAKTSAAEAWFVGDHPVIDMEGARGAGMTAVWLAGTHPWPAEIRPPDLEITHLGELLDHMALR